MCLHIKSSFVAEKPIFVYKIGRRSNECIVTFFQESLLPFNKLNIDCCFDEEWHKCLLSSLKYVGFGYFHAFTSLSRAKDLIINTHCDDDCYLAIIPKGSVGFYGKDKNICANQMIFLNPDVPGFKEICS